jgi:hypothetical protein
MEVLGQLVADRNILGTPAATEVDVAFSSLSAETWLVLLRNFDQAPG